MSRYTWLLFDADGTLFDFKHAESIALENTPHQMELVVPSGFASTYHRINNALWRGFEAGELRASDIRCERFRMVFEDLGRTLSLDNVNVDTPQAVDMELSASPNPFNPQVNIRFVLPEAGKVLLQVFDLRGSLVRSLLDSSHPGGADTVVWRGDDETGRAMASGVYAVRLATEGRLIEKRITLVR